jgi:hypothetical protein
MFLRSAQQQLPFLAKIVVMLLILAFGTLLITRKGVTNNSHSNSNNDNSTGKRPNISKVFNQNWFSQEAR